MLDQLIEKIIQNPLFLRLKDVVENNSYHDHEDVYSHAIKTKDVALKEIKADFIANPEARKSFTDFTDEDFHGMKRADVMILIALLHDIGKILHVKEVDKTRPLMVTDENGITLCPGHEFWGSTIVGRVLQDLSLPKEIVNYISQVVKLHDTFNPGYWIDRKDWSMDSLVNDIKSRAEGLYKEALFNIYCDCFTVKPFQNAKEIIVKIFNDPNLYKERHYVIA